MTTPSIPRNAYTHTPEQHRNIMLGTLQLIFWLVFRPSAWANYVHYLVPSSSNNFYLSHLLKNQCWKQPKVLRFLIQGFFLLPLTTSLLSSLIFLGFGILSRQVVVTITIVIVINILGSIVLGMSRVTFGLAFGVVFGLAGGLFGISLPGSSASSLLGGVVLGLLGGSIASFAFGLEEGKAGQPIIGVMVGLIFGLLGSLSVGLASGLVSGLLAGLVFGLAVGVGMWVHWWRPVLMSALLIPWNDLLYRIDLRRVGRLPSVLHRHLAFWDEWQFLPIWGLDKHLLLLLERSPFEGLAALDYLSTSRQRWAAQAAQIELDARRLERCTDMAAIAHVRHGTFVSFEELVGPADALFSSFNRLCEDSEAAMKQASTYNQRLALNLVSERLDALVRELTRSSDKYAVRFRPIAQSWRTIVSQHIQELTEATELLQEIDSPYIIGVPLTEQQEIFVGRVDVCRRLEQLLLDRRQPPLLLYGQRRTGKTSLLNNLGRMLPRRIIPMFVDLQGPASSASDHAGFLYNLAKGMIVSAKRQRGLALTPLPRETLTNDPFTTFDEWLDQVESELTDSTALLALDEFEALDQVLTEGRFSETSILGMLRNLIQHRYQFKVLLSGSHTLEEFQRWSSYLINVQVVHLGYLQESEARQLIEHPIEDFKLRYEPNASQRVLDVTSGHPFLVQLLCAEIVAFKNEQDPSIRRLATLADVEAAIPEALNHGNMFFSDVKRKQVDANALAVLWWFALKGEGAMVDEAELFGQFPDSWQGAVELLLRRELIERSASGYRFRVELIRRWFIRG
jgi:hypothetical protein